MSLSDIVSFGLIAIFAVLVICAHFPNLLLKLVRNNGILKDAIYDKLIGYMITVLGTILAHVTMIYKFNNYHWFMEYINNHTVPPIDIVSFIEGMVITIIIYSGFIFFKKLK